MRKNFENTHGQLATLLFLSKKFIIVNAVKIQTHGNEFLLMLRIVLPVLADHTVVISKLLGGENFPQNSQFFPHWAPDVADNKSCTGSRHELYLHQYLFSQVLGSLHTPHVNIFSKTLYIMCD